MKMHCSGGHHEFLYHCSVAPELRAEDRSELRYYIVEGVSRFGLWRINLDVGRD